MSSNDIFNKKVIPIMDKVMKDLRHKQLEEIGRHTSSLSYIMAGAAGPDGGMAAQAASLDSLRYTGKWNSKHTEDYILLVKEELRKQKITVTPDMEKRMIDKMIKDEIPRSSIEYILKKAASNTIFYLPQAMNKSPLENHISEQAEKKYNAKNREDPKLLVYYIDKKVKLVWDVKLRRSDYPDEVFVDAFNGDIVAEDGPISEVEQ